MRPLSHTIFIGRDLQHFNRLDSTNTYLRNLLNVQTEKITEGLLVITDEQFAGKGQLGAGWVSEAGKNLTFSILLRPTFLLPAEIFYLNKAIALAVRDCVGDFITGQTISIKWPNDIYAGNKKIAGILIENGFQTTAVQYTIVGIGLNVNQTEFDIAIPNPVSMKMITGKDFDLQIVLEKLCGAIEQYYLMLRRFDFKQVDDLYHTHLYGIGKERKFKSAENEFSGIIEGVDANGKLILKTGGEEKKFEVKEIGWLIP